MPPKLGKNALNGEAACSAAWSQVALVPRHTPLRTPLTGSREQLLMDISGKSGVRGGAERTSVSRNEESTPYGSQILYLI